MRELTSVSVDPNYTIERLVTGLNAPIHLQMVRNSIYYGDSGMADGNGKLLRLTDGGEEVIAEGFTPPLTGITYHDGAFYVSHKGSITRVTERGEKRDIVVGLPSFGDYSNGRVTVGPDGKLYFGQGTATNSGVVGLDNRDWLLEHPYFCDYPARDIILTGENFVTESIVEGKKEPTITGAFSPFGRKSRSGELVRHILPGSGSVLRVNPDGSNLELVAWGLRLPICGQFDAAGRLYFTNQGMKNRGSRPIFQAPDELIQIEPNRWYGWPDYAGGYPITNPYFKPPDQPQPRFLIAYHPMIPPHPMINFPPYSGITGFAINHDPAFGPVGEFYFAEFGPTKRMIGNLPKPAGVGHRITKFNPDTGMLTPFVFNRNYDALIGTIRLERPIDVLIGPDHAIYILDYGIYNEETSRPLPYTGSLWKVTRQST